MGVDVWVWVGALCVVVKVKKEKSELFDINKEIL